MGSSFFNDAFNAPDYFSNENQLQELIDRDAMNDILGIDDSAYFGNTNSFGFQQPSAAAAPNFTTPPAPAPVFQQQVAPVAPMVAAINIAPVAAAPVFQQQIAPVAPMAAANNIAPVSVLQWQAPMGAAPPMAAIAPMGAAPSMSAAPQMASTARMGAATPMIGAVPAPAKKRKTSKAKKEKRGAAPSYNQQMQTLNNVNGSHNPSMGLGITPVGYQPSTNPSHARLLHGVQTQQYNAPPQANFAFGAPPVAQMQTTSSFTPQQNFATFAPHQQAQQFNAPMTQQSLSSFHQASYSSGQPANIPSHPQEVAVKELDVYTIAAQAKLDSMLSGAVQPDTVSEDLSDIPDLAAHVEHARELFLTSTPKQIAEFLGSSAEVQTKMIADAAALSYAKQMFKNQSADSLNFFLGSSPEMKNQIMNNTAGFEPPQEKMKRKRADSVVGDAPLYSPFTENFINKLQDTNAVFADQEEARHKWEVANAKRELDERAVAAQQKNDNMHVSAATYIREATPESPDFSFGDDDSQLPGFEDDVEPAEEVQEEADTVAEQPAVTEPTIATGSEEATTDPSPPLTPIAIIDDSEDEMSSLFGDDDEEPPAPTQVPSIPRSSFPQMSSASANDIPTDIPNAFSQEDLDFQTMLDMSLGGPLGYSANHTAFDGQHFNMDGTPATMASDQPFQWPQGDMNLLPDINSTNPYEQGLALMNSNEENQESFEDDEQDVPADDFTYPLPPVHNNPYMTAPTQYSSYQQQQSAAYPTASAPIQQAPTQYTAHHQQQSAVYPTSSAPVQHTAHHQQQSASYPTSFAPAQQAPAPLTAIDADDQDLDTAITGFVNNTTGTARPAPPQNAAASQQTPLLIQPQPPLTAAGPDRPLCQIFLSSNGTHCPHGFNCQDRHFYPSGPAALGQALGSQVTYMAAHPVVQDQDFVQEGLLIKNFKRGARLWCKTCHKEKPVTLKNDGVRCTPCFKRWAEGSE